MTAAFCQEVDAFTERIAWLNTTMRHRPRADVCEEAGKLAADFGDLVNRCLADLSPDCAARALRMAADLAGAAREGARGWPGGDAG